MRFTPKFLLSATSPDHFPNEARTAGAPEVAFLGRSNVGKSSLINKLLGSKEAKSPPPLAAPVPSTSSPCTKERPANTPCAPH